MNVKDAMTQPVVTVSLQASIFQAARLMLQQKIRARTHKSGSANGSVMSASLRLCCKTIFATEMRNIDSILSTSTQHRFKPAFIRIR